jgi:hypothetical protein
MPIMRVFSYTKSTTYVVSVTDIGAHIFLNVSIFNHYIVIQVYYVKFYLFYFFRFPMVL